MHIVECHFECSGYDDHLVKAGTSVYLWNLVRQFRDRGHRVTAVTASHGLLPRLRERYEVTDLGWERLEHIPVRLDPAVWPSHPAEVTLTVRARAWGLRIDGIELVLLDGGLLSEFPDAFYPPRRLEGVDLAYLKPLAFQVLAARYLADRVEPDAVVHLHEPVYHHLLPAALSARGFTVVSTVQTNLPVNAQVYRPQTRALLEHLGADPAAADGLADPPLDGDLHRAMRGYLPRTLLYSDGPGGDYISVLALVVRTAAALDFLSEGQLEHAVTQGGTPFEQLFRELAVRRELLAHRDRLVVGGCAIGDEWHTVERSPQRREATLAGLGLDPRLPTVYHNGRYQIEHKGIRELLRGLRLLLDGGVRANVLVHLLAPGPIADEDLAALTRDHPDLVRASDAPMTSAELMDWAAAADICVFPAKFEMDTFLMAQGEAMAAGAIPLATAQRGTRHFGHAFDLADPGATGLALPRSFRVDDRLLAAAVHDGLRRLVGLVADDDPLVAALRERAVATARQFTWGRVAERFLAVFAACRQGRPPAGATPLDRPPVVGPAPAPIGEAVLAADGARVSWSGPPVGTVEAVRPTADGGVVVVALRGGAGSRYAADLPEPGGPVAVLVTGRDGRSVWDRATREDGAADGGDPVRAAAVRRTSASA
ncbi:glycosyltransferase [Dactylosporangium sp. CA-139114]|uniref:glycosyltransferase n=1 Tax=Dactylosporangium sp. CA-139114 TaxID=3239931 RepID=UPI003D996861